MKSNFTKSANFIVIQIPGWASLWKFINFYFKFFQTCLLQLGFCPLPPWNKLFICIYIFSLEVLFLKFSLGHIFVSTRIYPSILQNSAMFDDFFCQPTSAMHNVKFYIYNEENSTFFPPTTMTINFYKN